jgi:hypothetical protein
MKATSFGTLLIISAIIAFAGGCTTQPKETTVPDQVDETSYYAFCGGQEMNLGDVLSPITTDMEAQKIPYSQDPKNEWRDCSGNFLRLSSYLASACPENQRYLAAPPGISDYTPGGNNVAPAGARARSSRDIAKWYESQGRFTAIYYDGVSTPSEIPPGLREHRNLIRPGAVLWFSLARPSSADGLDGLFTKRVSRGPHINHMGTVTKVTRNETGQVIRFAMYHGRSTGKPGSVTRAHYWTWPEDFLANGTKEYPSLGYWNQYLVGIGTIVPVVSPPG